MLCLWYPTIYSFFKENAIHGASVYSKTMTLTPSPIAFNYCPLYYYDDTEQVWHLCQIFLLTSPNLVSIELAKWLKTSTGQLFFGDMDAALQQMDSMDQPELYVFK